MPSGWGTQDASGSGWGSAEQQASGAFDTGAMATALPNTNGQDESGGGPGASGQPSQAATGGSTAQGTVGGGWAPSQKYDYEQFADSRGGDFDGNKRIYHWDGEEGDLGPEFPELEEELFGPADKRELPTGIDFSR
jgi:ATP-dependent RNA helicase DDX3X